MSSPERAFSGLICATTWISSSVHTFLSIFRLRTLLIPGPNPRCSPASEMSHEGHILRWERSGSTQGSPSVPLWIWVPAHLLQMTTQRLMEAQSGLGEPQSAQTRFDSTAQILSATSELESASVMDCCMASTHSSFSCSESAQKLPGGMGVRDTMAWGGQHPQHPLPTLELGA